MHHFAPHHGGRRERGAPFVQVQGAIAGVHARAKLQPVGGTALNTVRLCLGKAARRWWEREVSTKIRNGEDAGWRAHGFIPRFGAALDACGGRSL